MNQPGSEVIEKISSNCMKITRHGKNRVIDKILKVCGVTNYSSVTFLAGLSLMLRKPFYCNSFR